MAHHGKIEVCSELPNQINNVLVFPGVFRGLMDGRIEKLGPEVMVAAVQAIADLVGDDLDAEAIVPDVFDERLVPAVADAVSGARATGSQ